MSPDGLCNRILCWLGHHRGLGSFCEVILRCGNPATPQTGLSPIQAVGLSRRKYLCCLWQRSGLLRFLAYPISREWSPSWFTVDQRQGGGCCFMLLYNIIMFKMLGIATSSLFSDHSDSKKQLFVLVLSVFLWKKYILLVLSHFGVTLFMSLHPLLF